ncbi:MAG: polysaccharide deacetylase family protein [Amphiplicatus sp.]
MRVTISRLAALACAGLGLAGAVFPLAAQGAEWPDGKRAAIALTYDDAIASQLDIAIPQLDAAGLKGTFFVSRLYTPEAVRRWRAVAEAGHELGNHSLNHPCNRGAFEMPAQYNNENYSVETMLTEIGAMNALLFAMDGKTRRAYATPCGHTIVGGEDYMDALRKSGLVTAVRDAGGPQPAAFDPFNVSSRFFPETVTGAELIAYVEGVKEEGGLGVMGFHGVGGDYLIVTEEAHQQLVSYLRAHEDEIWVAPFGDIVDYLAQAKPAKRGQE